MVCANKRQCQNSCFVSLVQGSSVVQLSDDTQWIRDQSPSVNNGWGVGVGGFHKKKHLLMMWL